MLFKILINYFLNKLSYFKLLIYFYKKFFFSKKDKITINKKTNLIKKVFFKKNNFEKEILFNPVFGYDQIEYYEFLTYFFKIFELNKFKPTIFSSYKSYEIFKSANFNMRESLIYYSNLGTLKNFNKITEKLNTIKDIIDFKFKDIECGKFALSSTFRITRKGEINLKNKN